MESLLSSLGFYLVGWPVLSEVLKLRYVWGESSFSGPTIAAIAPITEQRFVDEACRPLFSPKRICRGLLSKISVTVPRWAATSPQALGRDHLDKVLSDIYPDASAVLQYNPSENFRPIPRFLKVRRRIESVKGVPTLTPQLLDWYNKAQDTPLSVVAPSNVSEFKQKNSTFRSLFYHAVGPKDIREAELNYAIERLLLDILVPCADNTAAALADSALSESAWYF